MQSSLNVQSCMVPSEQVATAVLALEIARQSRGDSMKRAKEQAYKDHVEALHSQEEQVRPSVMMGTATPATNLQTVDTFCHQIG